MERIKVEAVRSRLQVTCPYDERFVLGAHRIGGRWRPRMGIWSFLYYQEQEVRTLLMQVFGWTREKSSPRGMKHENCGGTLRKLVTMLGTYQCQVCKELVPVGVQQRRPVYQQNRSNE